MALADYLREHVERTMNSYREQPDRILEDAREELQLLSGGYGHRQLYELIQNGADAIQDSGERGKVELLLTPKCLYCANEGAELTQGGIRALLMAHLSDKVGDQIGRFGLGFKSVLGICDQPEVFSHSISFRFNPAKLSERMRDLIGPEHPLPHLRTASILDREEGLGADEDLRTLATWAATTVKLPLKPESFDRLVSDIREFPVEFMVFSPHVRHLSLRVPELDLTRNLHAEAVDGKISVTEDGMTSNWRVFSTTLRVADLAPEAMVDMDLRLRERENLPLMWTVPEDSTRRRRGRLWSFFPTQDELTLQGILNAPWKTNSDRENLLDGDFNQELLGRAADLITAKVVELNTTQDPTRFLDVLPARDDVGWADRILGESVFRTLSTTACMPTNGGDLEVPNQLALRPRVSGSLQVQDWFKDHGHHEPSGTLHRSAEQGDRPSRARRLGCVNLDLTSWIESIVLTPSTGSSIAAIHLAGSVLEIEDLTAKERTSVLEAAFVFTKDGQLAPPDKEALVFQSEAVETAEEHHRLIHPDICADPDARAILSEKFGIGAASYESVFRAFLAAMTPWSLNWDQFWELARRLDAELAAKMFRQSQPRTIVHAKALDDHWKVLHCMLLPGEIAAEPVSNSAAPAFIDTQFHRDDIELLRKLGATEAPARAAKPHSSLYDTYEEVYALPRYRARCVGRNPHRGSLRFESATYVEPVDPIKALTGAEAVRYSAALLPFALEEPEWTMVHKNTGYPDVTMTAFLPWVLRDHGWLETSIGNSQVAEAVGPSLEALSPFLPVAKCDARTTELFGLPTKHSEIGPPQWQDALRRSLDYSGELNNLTAFYALAATHDVPAPPAVRALCHGAWEESKPDEVTVTSDVGELAILKQSRKPVLYSPREQEVAVLIDNWGLKPAPISRLIFDPSEEAMRAIDRFPKLRDKGDIPPEVSLQPCSILALESRTPELGTTRQEIPFTYRDSTFYYLTDVDEAQSASWLLAQIALHTDSTLSEKEQRLIAQDADHEHRRMRVAQVQDSKGVEEKLLAAVGISALRAGIPTRHLAWLAATGNEADHEVARLARAVHGVEILKAYQEELAAQGFGPPRRWAGGAGAISFVQELGFPEEYAGFPGQGRAPWEDVIGPVTLPDLHNFQERMHGEIIRFLQAETPERGILSLPTGAGKTRVAVQSIIDWITALDADVTLLWIAQSDELCEQAVEGWLQVWRAIGRESQMLRVNRLWGSTNERCRLAETGSTLTVSTFQSLANRLERDDMAWVFDPAVVVIDEAHGSIAPSYTRILERLGLGQRESARPLIGLTATPFRGDQDERETFRLAFRYGHRRFDIGFAEARDLYHQLQEMEVLAQTDRAELEGEELTLNPEELQSLETFGRLPPSAESRLGENEARNHRILDHIRDQPDDWPILLFATSVENAEDLAVRLTMHGVSACAITGSMSTGRRRHAIEAFKKGRIRVLTNYGVLTTGFDAPSVRAVYVTRPVYSPVLYQQMIGRGLRGPRNGGEERCLIINVTDNIRQFGDELAFHRFEHIWHNQAPAQ